MNIKGVVILRKRRIVIIGGGMAGLVAGVNARKRDAKAEVTVLSKEPHPPYRKSSLPCVIQGAVSRLREIAIYSPQLLESRKIRLLQGFEAQCMDPGERTVKTRTQKTKKEIILTTTR